MWVISKEGLIIVGAVLVLGVVGLVLLLQPERPPAVQAPAPIVARPSATVAAPPVAPVPIAPAPPPAVAQPVAPPETSVIPKTAIDGVIYGGEYAHMTEAADFQIHWSNDAQTLRVGLISPGLGYLAIGFDPVSRMEGANFILGAVINGIAFVRDDYGIGAVAHGPDAANGGRDNVLESAGFEADGKTYFEFVIPLDSGDPTDKALVPGETYEILIAFHRTSDDFGAWHSRRGTGSITLDPAPVSP